MSAELTPIQDYLSCVLTSAVLLLALLDACVSCIRTHLGLAVQCPRHVLCDYFRSSDADRTCINSLM